MLAAIGVVCVAAWLFWLADRGPKGENRTRLDTNGLAAPPNAPVSDASSDSSAKTAPYAHVAPDVPPPDSSEVDPPLLATPDPQVTTGPVDSSIAAVESDLDDRKLVIPVQGIRPNQLIDTYNEARSAGRVHNAIDIIADRGTPVVAVTGSTVLKLFKSDRGGITLYLLDPDGRTVYYYAHLQGYAPGIVEGKRVRQGEVIGYVGDSGNAVPGNTHLHFEITIVQDRSRFWSGVPVNPYPLLRR